MNNKRCGNCYFAEIMPQDFTTRICFGAPPTAAIVQIGPGKMAQQMIRPIVKTSDRACALYRAKGVEEIERDAEVMRQQQDNAITVPMTETKQ
jgi:hypothetical protein